MRLVGDRHVVQFGIRDHRQVGRQGPGRRGPDDERRLLPLEPRVGLPQITDDREADIDRRRGVVLVFDLGLGQRRVMREAPVHRLLVAVDEPGAREPGQLAGDRRLVVLRQRQVGVVPVAEAAEPLELGAHDVDELQRVPLAVAAEVGGAQLSRLRPQLFFDLLLDRQPVAVPAGAEHRPLAHQQLRPDDDVLEHLVEDRSVVDGARRVGGAVVEHEGRGPLLLARLQNLFVLLVARPAGKPLRLAAREIGAHREFSLREIERCFPVHGPAHTTKGIPQVPRGTRW